MQVTDDMVNRFLCWKLPADFSPDAGVSFKTLHAHESPLWPVGTNLFTAAQARAMLEHVLAGNKTPEGEAHPVEVWRGDRKVTIYGGETVLRVWGADVNNEMSEEPHTLATAQAAMDWLYAARPAPEGDAKAKDALREALDKAIQALPYRVFTPSEVRSLFDAALADAGGAR